MIESEKTALIQENFVLSQSYYYKQNTVLKHYLFILTVSNIQNSSWTRNSNKTINQKKKKSPISSAYETSIHDKNISGKF